MLLGLQQPYPPISNASQLGREQKAVYSMSAEVL